MIDADDVVAGEVTARDLRPTAADDRRALVGASARGTSGWDWEADELAADARAELEELRAERASAAARLAELETSLAQAAERETELRGALRRLSQAGWRSRRRLMTELREARLLDA